MDYFIAPIEAKIFFLAFSDRKKLQRKAGKWIAEKARATRF